MTGGQPDPGFRYWAFISYSHTDKSWGSWLHKALETYPIPRRLVGTPIAAGTVPARLAPVFRDRDELPTATDLGYTIEEALRQSWCLIVICSPASAKSRWVNEEVLAFQRLGRGDRIHCLIVEGGSDAAATPCFPPALAELMHVDGDTIGEPIGADARADADGRTNAKLKLVAGILGVGFDKLVRREQQRRHRNLFLVTCASLLLAAVLAVFAIVTVTSRRDADSQRNHAEGLVEFMLGDLRKKLEPDGKLATLDAVGKEALAYYAAQKPETLDADALARRARALQQIGEVFNLRGQLDDALGVFKQAAETTAELLERDADSPQRIFDHAQSVYWVGFIAYQRGDFAVAEPAFQKYKEFAERLVTIDPDNEKWQAELGYANSNLGTMLFEQSRYDDAEQVFVPELALAKSVLTHASTAYSGQVRVGQANAWLADTHFMQGRFHEAAAQRQAEIAIYEDALARSSNNHDAKELLAVAERALGNINLSLGETASAIAQLKRARELARDLVRIDPENTRWMESAAAAETNLGEALVEDDATSQAKESASRARELAVQLLNRDESVMTWQIRWAGSMLLDAEILARNGEALASMRLGQAVVQRLETLPESPLRKSQRVVPLARAMWLVARQCHRLGQTDDAERLLRQIIGLLEPKSDMWGPHAQAMLTVSLAALGKTEAAQPLINMLENMGYRHPAYVNALRETHGD